MFAGERIYSRALQTAFILLVLPGLAFSQSGKEAFRGFKKLEAKIQIGISYPDYNAGLGDAKFELNMFLDSPEAKSRPEIAESLQKVMDHYINAGLLFKELVKPIKCLPTTNYSSNASDSWKADVERAKSVLRIYPEASAFVDGRGYLDIDKAMKIIWQKASDELKKTANLFN